MGGAEGVVARVVSADHALGWSWGGDQRQRPLALSSPLLSVVTPRSSKRNWAGSCAAAREVATRYGELAVQYGATGHIAVINEVVKVSGAD